MNRALTVAAGAPGQMDLVGGGWVQTSSDGDARSSLGDTSRLLGTFAITVTG